MNHSDDDTPWTTNQMRQNSSNWTLEGDAKLLLYLKAFSNNLCERSKATKGKLDAMIGTLDYTQVALGNSTNRFHALQHSQFVESRVYEEDIQVAVPDIQELVPEEVKIDPAIIAKQAVLSGLKLMETQYVKVPLLHHQGDNSRCRYVPKDKYSLRPLPPRIGSKQFLASLNPSESESEGGLGSSRSGSASSQSKSCSPLPGIRTGRTETVPAVPKVQPHLFGQSSDDDEDTYSVHQSQNDKNPDASSNKSSNSYEKSQSPVKIPSAAPKPKPRENYPILFNEGPPIDISEQNKCEDTQNLFDSEDEGLFEHRDSSKKSNIFHDQIISKPKIVNLFDDQPPVDNKSPVNAQKNTTGTNLFDNESDEDLFAEYNKVQDSQNNSKMLSRVRVFPDEPPAVANSKSKGAVKKSVDDKPKIEKTKTKAVDLFNSDSDEDGGIFASPKIGSVKPRRDQNIDLFNDTKNIVPKISKKDSANERSSGVSMKNENVTKKEKSISLFDDDDEDIKIESNIFSKTSSKQKSLNLFEDEPPLVFGDSISKSNKRKDITQKISLFNDSDDEDIFANLIKNEVPKKTPKSDDLFGDGIDKAVPVNNIKKQDDNKSDINKGNDEKSLEKIIQKPDNNVFTNNSQSSSRFVDLFEDEDDLFSTGPSIKKITDHKPAVKVKTENIEPKLIKNVNTVSEINKQRLTASLFDSTDEEDLFGDIKKSKMKSAPILEKSNTDKINAGKSKVQSKIVGIFEDPIFREDLKESSTKSALDPPRIGEGDIKLNKDKTKINETKNERKSYAEQINKDDQNNLAANVIPRDREAGDSNLFTDSQKKSTSGNKHDAAKSIKEKTFDATKHVNDDIFDSDGLNISTERKKSLYEEAASNIALFADEPPADIFEDCSVSKKSDPKRISLFDDDDEPDFFQNLTKSINTSPIGIGLFDSEPPLDFKIDKHTKENTLFYKSDNQVNTMEGTLKNHENLTTTTTTSENFLYMEDKSDANGDSASNTTHITYENDVGKSDLQTEVALPGASQTNEPRKLSKLSKLSSLSSLNIDVSTLLPGATARAPFMRKDNDDVTSTSTNHETIVKQNGGIVKVTSEQKHDYCRNGDFIEKTETLRNSAFKDRAKIRSKRRPPTRRARVEAARKSLISDLQSEEEEDSLSSEDRSKTPEDSRHSTKEDTMDEKDKEPEFQGLFAANVTTTLKIDHNSPTTPLKPDLGTPEKSAENSLSLNTSTEEDDIFRMERLADDDTLKVDEYNNIFNGSDDSDTGNSSLSDSGGEDDESKPCAENEAVRKEFRNIFEGRGKDAESGDIVKSRKEFNLIEAASAIENDVELLRDKALKLVPEILDITRIESEISVKDSICPNILNDTVDEVLAIPDGSGIYSGDLGDRLSTLAIDGSAEVIYSGAIDKTSKDRLFDSDLEEDHLFTARPIRINEEDKGISQKGDARSQTRDQDLFSKKPRKVESLFSDTEEDEDLFKSKSESSKAASSGTDLPGGKKKKAKQAMNLFGDSDEDDEDLFKSSGKSS